jgi:hypothetical protein
MEKDVDRNNRILLEGNIPVFSLKDLGKPRSELIVVDVPAEMIIWHLPNTS